MHAVNKFSVAVLATLVALAVYAGGSSGVLLSYSGGSGPPPPMSDLNLTNQTIGNNDGQQVSAAFEINFSGACGSACGGMVEAGDNFVWTAVDDNWLLNWQSGGFANCVGQDYEIRWSTDSGTLDSPPFGSSEALPEDTWSDAEWIDSLTLCDANWFGGVFPGPIFTQNGASANAIITIEIRSTDLTEGPVSAQFTFNP